MTKIMGFFRKIDDRVLGVLNDAYLWMLDWTGVYVATVVFISCAPSFAYMWNKSNGSHVWQIIWLMIVLVMSANLYWMQNTGSKIAFNALAESYKGMLARTIFIWLDIADVFLDLFLNKGVLAITSDICNVLFWYIICIKIRDREKKKFEFKVPGLAYDTHS